jgi:hypothetical protein
VLPTAVARWADVRDYQAHRTLRFCEVWNASDTRELSFVDCWVSCCFGECGPRTVQILMLVRARFFALAKITTSSSVVGGPSPAPVLFAKASDTTRIPSMSEAYTGCRVGAASGQLESVRSHRAVERSSGTTPDRAGVSGRVRCEPPSAMASVL